VTLSVEIFVPTHAHATALQPAGGIAERPSFFITPSANCKSGTVAPVQCITFVQPS
jgi:hypothetical protein